MTEEPDRRGPSDRGAWIVAWSLALALHLGLWLGVQRLPLFAGAPPEPQVVELVFPDEVPATEEPSLFTELPPDRADAAPEKASLLSNVTSRARDRVPGGDRALPRMRGDGDAAMVEMDQDDPSSRPRATAQPAPRTTEPKDDAEAGVAPTQRDRDVARRARDATSRGTSGSAGGSDIHQPESGDPEGNAALTGDISLNTTAWDYAPWLQRFRRQLMRRWVAPPAYVMGLLPEGGSAVLELEISRSGEPLRFELLEQQGHASLILAAQSAVRSMAPYERLPADFPEPTLVLRLRMIYPGLSSPVTRRRVPPTRPSR